MKTKAGTIDLDEQELYDDVRDGKNRAAFIRVYGEAEVRRLGMAKLNTVYLGHIVMQKLREGKIDDIPKEILDRYYTPRNLKNLGDMDADELAELKKKYERII